MNLLVRITKRIFMIPLVLLAMPFLAVGIMFLMMAIYIGLLGTGQSLRKLMKDNGIEFTD